MKLKAVTILVLLAIACNPDKPDNETLVKQVRNTEQSFSDRAQESGMGEAFLAFADENAVLVRNNKVIRGKKEIAEFFGSQPGEGVTLSWKPDFIEVAQAGDLAYTYGQYSLIRQDSAGNKHTNTGVFHTVWKRQADGSWKFVYD
jgi:ketosteroid isomerase-like protein